MTNFLARQGGTRGGVYSNLRSEYDKGYMFYKGYKKYFISDLK
jgi:hypothetical protein